MKAPTPWDIKKTLISTKVIRSSFDPHNLFETFPHVAMFTPKHNGNYTIVDQSRRIIVNHYLKECHLVLLEVYGPLTPNPLPNFVIKMINANIDSSLARLSKLRPEQALSFYATDYYPPRSSKAKGKGTNKPPEVKTSGPRQQADDSKTVSNKVTSTVAPQATTVRATPISNDAKVTSHVTPAPPRKIAPSAPQPQQPIKPTPSDRSMTEIKSTISNDNTVSKVTNVPKPATPLVKDTEPTIKAKSSSVSSNQNDTMKKTREIQDPQETLDHSNRRRDDTETRTSESYDTIKDLRTIVQASSELDSPVLNQMNSERILTEHIRSRSRSDSTSQTSSNKRSDKSNLRSPVRSPEPRDSSPASTIRKSHKSRTSHETNSSSQKNAKSASIIGSLFGSSHQSSKHTPSKAIKSSSSATKNSSSSHSKTTRSRRSNSDECTCPPGSAEHEFTCPSVTG